MDEIVAYLNDLDSAAIQGRCAGIQTDVTKLHQNRLVSDQRARITTKKIVQRLWVIVYFANKEAYVLLKKKSSFKRIVRDLMTMHSNERLNSPGRSMLLLERFYSQKLPVKVSELVLIQELIDGLVIDSRDHNKFEYNKPFGDSSSILYEGLSFGKGKNRIFPVNDSWLIEENFDAIIQSLNNESIDLVSHVFQSNSGLDEQQGNSAEFEDTRLSIICGDPGFGKTIQMRQFLTNLIPKVKSGQINTTPIFVKAKSLYEQLNDSEGHFDWSYYGDLDFNNDGHLSMILDDCLPELQEQLISAAIDSEPELDSELAKNALFHDIQYRNYTILIDAYDEINGDFRIMNGALKFILENSNSNIILSCRNSHLEKLELNSPDLERYTTVLKIDFTVEELRHEMPVKLAAAWGINGDQLSFSFDYLYDDYKDVLTHPLFVGLFCMLIKNKASAEPAPKSGILNTGNNDSTLAKNIRQVEFLRQVIEYGLKVNIQDRVSNISDEQVEEIKTIFSLISLVYLTAGITDIDEIFTCIDSIFGIKINKEQNKIIKENLGVLFISGSGKIEWTHKTLPEVSAGQLLSENSEFLKIHQNFAGGTFGRDFSLVSENLFLSYILKDLKDYQIDPDSKARIINHILETGNSQSIALNSIDMNKQLFSNIKFDEIEGKFSFTSLNNINKNSPIYVLSEELGKQFFSRILTVNKFRLESNLFGQELTDQGKNKFLWGLHEGKVHLRDAIILRGQNVLLPENATLPQLLEYNNLQTLIKEYNRSREMYLPRKIRENYSQQLIKLSKEMLDKSVNPGKLGISFSPRHPEFAEKILSILNRPCRGLLDEILKDKKMTEEFCAWLKDIIVNSPTGDFSTFFKYSINEMIERFPRFLDEIIFTCTARGMQKYTIRLKRGGFTLPREIRKYLLNAIEHRLRYARSSQQEGTEVSKLMNQIRNSTAHGMNPFKKNNKFVIDYLNMSQDKT